MKDREECSRKERQKKEKEERKHKGKKHRSDFRQDENEDWIRSRRRRDSSSESFGRRKDEEEEEDRRRRRKRRSDSEDEERRNKRREGSVGGIKPKKRCRRHRRHSHSPSHHHSSIKEEPRDSEPSTREKSRWENGDESPEEPRVKRGGSLLRAIRNEDTQVKWGKGEGEGKERPPPENKAKPDFGLSGKLAQDTNTFNGVVIKYSEPSDARKPKRRWRLYPFKGDVGLPTLYVHRQSAYLIGRDRKIADLPVDHPSCSKQHAVLQYRAVPRPDGPGLRVVPYIIDLESSNGTYVNNVKIESKKFVELLEKDVIKFAYSSREYVLLHEHSKDDEADDHVQE